jgi:hypothetical protein
MMAGTYEPPCSEEGSILIPGQEDLLAPGVRGYALRARGLIYIPLIIAEKEGSGDVGRFLDSLSPNCVIPTVTSPRLGGMLIRRGFAPTHDGETDVWRR